MNVILEGLKNICDKHLLAKKVLLVDSYKDGNELVELAARENISLLNLKVETLLSFAENEFAGEIYKNKKKLIDSNLRNIYISKVLRALKKDNQLKYFSSVEINSGIIRSVSNAVIELRLAGYTGDTLPKDAFVNAVKAKDTVKIMKAYEGELTDKNAIDQADLYEMRFKDKSSFRKTIFINLSERILPLLKWGMNFIMFRYLTSVQFAIMI